MTRCSQFSSPVCSKSHFPSSKVQPTNSLLLRPGTLQKDILSISPFHASPSLLNMQNAFQSIPVCFFIRWVLRVLKLTKVYRFCHLLCWCHCRHLSVLHACGLGDNMTWSLDFPSHTEPHRQWAPLIVIEERKEISLTLILAPHYSF